MDFKNHTAESMFVFTANYKPSTYKISIGYYQNESWVWKGVLSLMYGSKYCSIYK